MHQTKASHSSDAMRLFDEQDIKLLVLRELLKNKRITNDATIASEYPLRHLGVRADLAIYQKYFIGVEIKSEFDSTKRLERQISAYCNLFDRIIVVLATKHIVKLNVEIPPCVEIWELTKNGRLKKRRTAAFNSSEVVYHKFMTKADVRRFLLTNVAGGGNEDKIAFFEAFKNKFGKTSKRFWESAVWDLQSLYLLSRYKPTRDKTIQRIEAEGMRWEQWLKVLAESKIVGSQSLHVSSVSYNPEVSP